MLAGVARPSGVAVLLDPQETTVGFATGASDRVRFFGGLTVEETAEVLQVSAQTVMRDWKTARTWLARELRRA